MFVVLPLDSFAGRVGRIWFSGCFRRNLKQPMDGVVGGVRGSGDLGVRRASLVWHAVAGAAGDVAAVAGAVGVPLGALVAM